MKSLLFIVSTLLACSVFAQQIPEFQTTIYIFDLNGHTDSVVIGYDTTAIYFVNSQFGEVAMTNPWDSVFEVRVGNHIPTEADFFVSKKRIAPWTVNEFLSATGATLCIRTETPVIISWNPLDFQENCRDSSIVFDDLLFLTYPFFPHDGKTFMSQHSVHATNFRVANEAQYFYLDNIEGGGMDTIRLVFIGIFDNVYGSLLPTQQQKLQSSTQVFPNPTQTSFTVRLPDGYRSEGLRVIDVSGRLMYEDNQVANELEVNTETWSRGIYFYQMQVEGGLRVQGKVAVY